MGKAVKQPRYKFGDKLKDKNGVFTVERIQTHSIGGFFLYGETTGGLVDERHVELHQEAPARKLYAYEREGNEGEIIFHNISLGHHLHDLKLDRRYFRNPDYDIEYEVKDGTKL